MRRASKARLVVTASLVAAAGLPVCVFAQAQPEPAAQPAPQPAPQPAADAPPRDPSRPIRFNFKDAPIDQVLDSLARESGVPIIYEAAVPQGTITFVSSAGYSFEDALSIVNLNLARFNVHLRRQEQYLYLATIQDSMRRPGVVSDVGQVDRLTPDTIVTVGIPLENARVEQVLEQVKALIGPNGGAVAVPTQNMLIIVEAAAQVRRIREVVEAIDAVRPVDSAFRLFPLRHAQADAVLNALKGLMGERQRTVIVDRDGQQRVVQDTAVVGLSLIADPRTNAIIAVGPAARLRTVEELITLLDVPGGTAETSQMATFTLQNASADEAARQIRALFDRVEEKERPTVIPLQQARKVTVIGSRQYVARAAALIDELDPGANAGAQAPSMSRIDARAATLRLRFASPQAVQGVISQLLTRRQQDGIRLAPTPDGKGLVIIGPDADVTALESLAQALDVEATADREVRLVRLADGDPAEILNRAQELYRQTGRAEREPIVGSVEQDSKTITLVGSKSALAAFDPILTNLQQASRQDLEARTFRLGKAQPSVLAPRLARLLRPMLASGEGQPEPTIEPIDELRTLVIRAKREQFAVIEPLLGQLDSDEAAGRGFRVVPVLTERASAVRERAWPLYVSQVGEEAAARLTVSADDTSGSLLLTGNPTDIERFSQVLGELQRQTGPVREVRLIELRTAKATEMIEFLRDLARSSQTLQVRGGADPVFEAIEATNSLLVAAQPAQLAVIEPLVRNLDARQTADRPPLRILRLRTTDAATIAQTFQRSFDARPVEERAAKPATIESDAATNTLIVSAHPDVLTEIEGLVSQLNAQDVGNAEGREIRIFPLRVARAEELAQTIDQMFPEPPMPLDPRTRLPRPDLRPPREIVVRADRATNALIVDAPAARLSGFEQIVRSLDQQRLSADVELRTYRLEKADVAAVATTLRTLAASGSLGGEGEAAVAPVTIEVEPVTRTLIVSGPKGIFATVERVLKELDETLKPPATELKMFALRSARADRLAPLLERVLTQRAREAMEAQGRTPAPGTRLVEIAADGASNTLVVTAPREVISIAEGLVAALDAPASANAAEVRVMRLGKGVAATVAPAVSAALRAQLRPGEEAPTLTPEPGSNTIVITGTREQLERAAKLIEEMDQSVDREGLGVRTLTLKHARAEVLAPVLEAVLVRESALDRVPDWARIQFLQRTPTGEPPRVRVAAERRLNALVVSGPQNVLDLAEQVATSLDVDPTGAAAAPERVVSVVTLRNADASNLAQSLQAVFADEPGEPPVIRVDAQANALIVRATPEQLRSIERLTGNLDAASLNATRQMRMIPLDRARADADLVAQTLRRLLEQQGGVRVEVISAEELLRRQRQGEQPPAEEPRPRQGTQAEPLNAPFLHTALTSAIFAVMQPAAGASPAQPVPDEEAGVTIAVDRASNSLVIVGSPRQSDRLAALAQQLQQQLPPEPVGVRLVQLPSSTDAGSILDVIRQTLAQIGRASAQNPGGFSGPVSVLPDPAGTSLIVLANDTDFATVRELIASVSAMEPASRLTLKVYPLQSVPADRVVRSLRDLFSAQPQGSFARRVRAMDVELSGPNGPVSARIDSSSIRVTPDPAGTSLIVAAPAEAVPVIDRLIETLDQSPTADRLAIRRYALTSARASELSRTFQELFDAQRQGPGFWELPQARFIADDRTNSMLVTATEAQHRDVQRMLEVSDTPLDGGNEELAIIALQQAAPSTVQRIIQEVVVGRDPARRDRVRVSAQDGSSILVVRASKEDLAQIRSIIAEVDKAETSGLAVRSIKLERADAQQVSAALQRFFQEQANISGRAGQRGVSRVAVVGDRRTGTLVVSASDEDFAQVESLVRTFDSPTSKQDFQFRVIQLRNARVNELAQTVRNVIDELRWEDVVAGWQGRDQGREAQIYIESDERTNSLVVVGRGDLMETVERVIGTLDRPAEDRAQTIIKSVDIRNADVRAVQSVIQRAFASRNQTWWRQTDADGVQVEIDRVRRAVILVGKAERVAQAEEYIRQIDQAGDPAAGRAQAVESITLQHGRADRVAANLRQFFTDRARAQGLDAPGVSVIGSPDGNVVIVSGDAGSVATVKDLVAQIDQPEAGSDRRIQVYAVQNNTAGDVAQVLRQMFARQGRSEEAVVITPQPSTNSLIVSAPGPQFEQIEALLRQLDAPPSREETNIETIALTKARAQEVATALRSALPPNVKVTVTPVVRSNSLILTGSKEAIEIAMEQIRKIDTEPVRSGLVFRRFALENAEASDVSFTVEQMLRARPRNANEPEASIDFTRADNTLTVYAAADEIEEIERIIRELDQAPAESRTTEFIRLKYANAEQTATALRVFYGRFAPEAQGPGARNVTILHDAMSNSLVIRADARQWEGIRALLAKLDAEEYDTSQQLEVIPLQHADASSVARALTEGLRAGVEAEVRRQQQQQPAQRRTNQGRDVQDSSATVLIDAEGLPSVSAEPQTNSLVVFAGRRQMERIKTIVRQLDAAGFAEMPAARIIALRSGKPSAVAQTLRQLFIGREERTPGPRAVLIIGDDSASALIVRAPDDKYAQIAAVAETLQQQGDVGRVQPHVVRLQHVAAARLRPTLLTTFTPTAQAQGETLAIEVDRASNALVIAASTRMLEEIKRVIAELDVAMNEPGQGGAANPLGQQIFIADIVNNDPAQIRTKLEEMGLTRPVPADRPSIVAEPISITTMSTRRGLAILASPGDGQAVLALIRTLDAAPADATQQIAILPLRKATAGALLTTLEAMLDPAAQQSATGPARALAEHVRRLQLTRPGVDQPEGEVDLSRPIRLLADAQTNSLVVISTPGNIAALREVVKTLDTLPVGEAVVVRIFPLENASASRIGQVVTGLFAQGEQLRRLPGTSRSGLPPTATGQALAGSVAVATDERTNSLIVAGSEEAVALVQVILQDLDSEAVSNWIEPAVIPMKHAAAADLAEKLTNALVRNLTASPEAAGLQRQFGRLRMLQRQPGQPPTPSDGSSPTNPDYVQADLFGPVTGLSISADEDLNALLVIGTPNNIAIVRQLVEMLDVEAAAAANQVRVFTLQHAAAERVAAVIRDVFRQREANQQQRRPEDQISVTADVRTNSLVISTSAKSFAIVESLLRTMDSEKANFSVGLHVLPVENADVRQLAPRVERLMRERLAAATQAGSVPNPLDAFSIDAEPTNNLLIVACSEENLQVIRELLAALTSNAEAIAGRQRVDVVQLTKVRAAEAAESVSRLYVDKENARRGANAVTVAPNLRLNALVVSGTEEDINQIRGLVSRLESADVSATQQIRWIELKSANATEVVELLSSVLAGRPLGGNRVLAPVQATRVRFVRDRLKAAYAQQGLLPTEAEIDGAIRDQVTLTADIRTNSVWITAPEAVMALIVEMVEDIEASTAGARRIEYFQLRNADARQMAQLLRDTFNLTQQGNSLVLVPTRRADANPEGEQPTTDAGVNGSTVTPVPDIRQQLSIAIDPRTNTLVVSGTEEYLGLVRKLVTELDSIEANEREQRVFHLRNANAKDIETTLQSYFRGEADRLRLTLGPQLAGSLQRRLEEEVTVVGDAQSNKLVISTSPRYMNTVLDIIRELDSAPPQVMIQVLLAEVTLDSEDTWGMDAKVGPLFGDAYRFGFNAAGAGVATAIGVPNLSVSSNDFSLLVRALEAQGRLEILSNPKVMVNNNQDAKIQVGDNIAIVDGVERTVQGQTIADVVRQDVGIILNVRPSITNDGFVRMEIQPEISQVSSRTTQISADFAAPIINKRTVDTTVTVRDGQSVVIGGLIQTTEQQRRTKVPGLGDIPILGIPFRTVQDTNVKTELLVILTPRVIPGQDAGSVELLDDVRDRSVDELEDPTKVQDYLERIRAEVRSGRRPNILQGEGVAPRPAPADVSPPMGERPATDPQAPSSPVPEQGPGQGATED